MPQVANMVLKDYAAADHTFTPQSVTSGVATYANSAGVPVGNNVVALSVKTTTTGKWKIVGKLTVPIVQDAEVSGVSKPTVVRTSYVNFDVTFDATSSTAERRDVLAYWKSLLANSQCASMIEDLSAPF